MKKSNESNKILPLQLKRLYLTEKIEYFGLVGKIVEKYFPSNSKEFVAAATSFNEVYLQLESRFNKARNPEITTQLTEIDNLRGNDIICLRMTAQGLSRHFDPAISAAGSLLVETIDLYGNSIYRMNYEEETAILRNLINDLKTRPNLVDALDKLNLKSLVINLEKNNNRFRELYLTRVADKSNEDSTVAEYIKETNLQYQALVRTIESIAYLNASDASLNIIAEINTLIQRHQEKLQFRNKRRERIKESIMNDEAGDRMD